MSATKTKSDFYAECLAHFAGTEHEEFIAQCVAHCQSSEADEAFRLVSTPPAGQKPIDFAAEVLNAKSGELRKYPLDDVTIDAFNITPEELRPFAQNKDYALKHWGVVLEEILNARRARYAT